MIKFVYFDVGGVLISDFSDGTGKWEEMKRIMGVKQSFENEFDEIYDKYELEDLCLTREVDSLIPIFEKRFSMRFPRNFSMQKYFVDHFDRNPYIWPVVSQARKSAGIGMLTNMYPGMLAEIEAHRLLRPIIWDSVVDSSVVGLQKPDPKIYEYATEQSGVAASQILYVDDVAKNTKAADRAGWNTFRYNPKDHKVSCERLRKIVDAIKSDDC